MRASTLRFNMKGTKRLAPPTASSPHTAPKNRPGAAAGVSATVSPGRAIVAEKKAMRVAE